MNSETIRCCPPQHRVRGDEMLCMLRVVPCEQGEIVKEAFIKGLNPRRSQDQEEKGTFVSKVFIDTIEDWNNMCDVSKNIYKTAGTATERWSTQIL